MLCVLECSYVELKKRVIARRGAEWVAHCAANEGCAGMCRWSSLHKSSASSARPDARDARLRIVSITIESGVFDSDDFLIYDSDGEVQSNRNTDRLKF